MTESALEAELIRQCRAGRSEFYEPLVRTHEAEALRVAVAILRDPESAGDAVQEAFIKAYRALPRFDADKRFRPWFLQILRNQCRDMLRRRAAGPGMERLDAVRWERLASSSDPSRDRERSAARELLWRALGRISAEHREVLVLKELEGMSYGEIAAVATVPEGTVASRLYHARRALRAALEELGAEYP